MSAPPRGSLNTTPRLAALLLRLTSRDPEVADGILGDLEEDIAPLDYAGRAPHRHRLWYWMAVLGLSAGFAVKRWTSGRRGGYSSIPGPRTKRPLMFDALIQDLRFALRSAIKHPRFAIMAVVTLGLGIGASTAMFSVVDQVLMKAVPFRNPRELVKVWAVNPGMREYEGWSHLWDHLGLSPSQFRRWQEGTKAFSDVAIFHASELSQMTLTGRGAARRLAVGQASASLLPLLDVRPVLGRGFLPQEEGHKAGEGAPVALLGEAFWKESFGGDPSAVGEVITLDGRPFTIIGVLPEGFRLRSFEPVGSTDVVGRQDLWVPVGASSFSVSGPFWDAIGRLEPGWTLEQAASETKSILFGEADRGGGSDLGAGGDVRLLPRQTEETQRLGSPLVLLLGGAGLLLLIGCGNLAILSLTEMDGRLREIAIRSALGAGRGRIVRQLLTESTLLSLMGGSAGISLAFLAIRMVGSMPLPIPRIDQVGVDARVLTFTVLLGLATGAIFGALPALAAARHKDVRMPGRGMGAAGFRSSRLQRGLVGIEVALTVLLLIPCGLMVRSLSKQMAVDPGFDPAGVASLEVFVDESRYSSPEAGRALLDELLRRTREQPGIVAASLAYAPPFPGQGIGLAPVDIGGAEGPRVTVAPENYQVWPHYHETLGIPLLQGRTFTRADGPHSPPVVLISQSFAVRYWHGESPVGATVRTWGSQGRDFTVIGVVGDVKRSTLTWEARPAIYYSMAQERPLPRLTLLARTKGDVAAGLGQMRDAVHAVDPDLPITAEGTMSSSIAASTRTKRLGTLLLGLFAGFATMLAALGVFGVTAHSVASRRGELGIRLALGAHPVGLAAKLVRHSVLTGLLGLGAGVLGAFLIGGLLKAFLFGIESWDPVTFGGVALLALVLCGAAALPPACRAWAVDPARVLREE